MSSPEISHKIFLPPSQTSNSGLEVISDALIVVGTHMASSVFRDTEGEESGYGDAARKAEALSSRTGYPVLIYDRPGTGSKLNTDILTAGASGIDDISKRTGEAIFTIMRREGLTSAILAGNSASATTETAVAATSASLHMSHELPVTHLCALDPVGRIPVTFLEGIERWSKFTFLEERKFEKPPRTQDDPLEAASGLSIKAFLRDAYTNHKTWETAAVIDRLKKMVELERYGHIAIRLEIPEHTFTSDLPTAQKQVAELSMRAQQAIKEKLRTAPVHAEVVEGSHSQYENFRVYATAIARVIDADFRGFDS